MSSRVKPGELGAAIEQKLTLYSEEVNEKLRQATLSSMNKLVKETQATAPTGKRGDFKRNIAAETKGLKRLGGNGLRGRTIRGTWYVKAPDYRITHLIVHGHATRDGGRTRGNPFLKNALNKVLPEYEEKVKEALKSDK